MTMPFFMNPHAEEAHGGNDEDDADDDDDDGETFVVGKRAVKRSRRPRSHGSRSRRLKSAASASHAVRQKPLVIAASGSCRLKSAATIDAEDVPVADHADESSRLRSAGVC